MEFRCSFLPSRLGRHASNAKFYRPSAVPTFVDIAFSIGGQPLVASKSFALHDCRSCFWSSYKTRFNYLRMAGWIEFVVWRHHTSRCQLGACTPNHVVGSPLLPDLFIKMEIGAATKVVTVEWDLVGCVGILLFLLRSFCSPNHHSFLD